MMYKILLIMSLLIALPGAAEAQYPYGPSPPFYGNPDMPVMRPPPPYAPNYGGGYPYGGRGPGYSYGYPPGYLGRTIPYSSSAPYYVPHNYGTGGGGYYRQRPLPAPNWNVPRQGFRPPPPPGYDPF